MKSISLLIVSCLVFTFCYGVVMAKEKKVVYISDFHNEDQWQECFNQNGQKGKILNLANGSLGLEFEDVILVLHKKFLPYGLRKFRNDLDGRLVTASFREKKEDKIIKRGWRLESEDIIVSVLMNTDPSDVCKNYRDHQSR